VDGLRARKSEGFGLIVRAISFQDLNFQRVCSTAPDPPTLQTDGRTDDMRSHYTALCTIPSASRGNNYCDVIVLSAAVAAAELMNDVTTISVMSHQSSSATVAVITAHDDDDHVDDDDYDNDYVNDVNTTRPHPPLIAQVGIVSP